MMTYEVESMAGEILRLAGADGDSPPRPIALARSLLGRGCVFTAHARSLPGDACYSFVDGAWRIYVRVNLTGPQRDWAICHELAEWWLTTQDTRDERIEQLANSVAAALLLPRRAFRCAVGSHGARFSELATVFSISETCAVLRYGEVTGAPTAIVSPATVRVRGEPFHWGSESQVRSLAKAEILPGILTRNRLSDAPRRTALVGG